MLKATATKVEWDPEKNHWRVRVEFGDEVIKRSLSGTHRDATEDALRSLAVQTAKDEGYEIDGSRVEITR